MTFSPRTRLARMTLGSLTGAATADHDERLDRRHPISRDSRYAGKREFERDRAGCRERRAGAAKGGPFLGRIDHDPRRRLSSRRLPRAPAPRDGARSAAQAPSGQSARQLARSRRRMFRADAGFRCPGFPAGPARRADPRGGAAPLRHWAAIRRCARSSGWPT